MLTKPLAWAAAAWDDVLPYAVLAAAAPWMYLCPGLTIGEHDGRAYVAVGICMAVALRTVAQGVIHTALAAVERPHTFRFCASYVIVLGLGATERPPAMAAWMADLLPGVVLGVLIAMAARAACRCGSWMWMMHVTSSPPCPLEPL